MKKSLLSDSNRVTLYVIAARVFDDPGVPVDQQLVAWYTSDGFVHAPTKDKPRIMRRVPSHAPKN